MELEKGKGTILQEKNWMLLVKIYEMCFLYRSDEYSR